MLLLYISVGIVLGKFKISVRIFSMMRIMSFSFSAIVALALSSCSVSTIASRIQEKPQVYQNLPSQEQSLVQVGNIAEGMTPQAVYIAWGQPTSTIEGNIDGIPTTRWLYSDLQPVFSPAPYVGCLGYAPWRSPYCYYPYNDVTYVPVNTAYVLFKNGKVVSWEKKSNEM